jgi:hypothetical protein
MFHLATETFSTGDVLVTRSPEGNSSRGVYIDPNIVIWVHPRTRTVVYSPLQIFRQYGRIVEVDSISNCKYEGRDVAERAAMETGKDYKWSSNEAFIEWVVKDVKPETPWKYVLAGASVGFYLGGIAGAAMGAVVGYVRSS